MTQLIDLGKLRFHFAGDWSNTTVYESNDIVKYGGNVYVYSYALKTSGNLPTDTAYWALMVEGFKFKGVFNTTTAYKVGDGVAHGGKVYVCVLDSTNQTPPNPTYWSQFADGIQYEGTYSPTASYQKNDVVVYGGSVYIAKVDTTNNNPINATYWDKFVEGVAAKGIYNAATAYVPGDMVAYGPNIYRATTNTTGNLPTDTSKWEIFITGANFAGTYNSNTTYYTNDLVVYGNTLYRSKVTQSNALPTTASWELLSGGTSFKGVYSSATTYKAGDIATYGANAYIALQDALNRLPTDTTYWAQYTAGFSYQGVWSSSTAYKVGQTVSYGGSLFQVKVDNSATNPTTTASWNKVVAGFKNRGAWSTTTQYEIDEVVTYGGNTYITLAPHAATTFDADLAAGNWQKFNSGVRWRGAWTAAQAYLKDDIVKDTVGTAYIAKIDHIASSAFTTDVSSNKWEVFVLGGSDVLPPVLSTDNGQSLTVKADGTGIDWIGATQSDNVYYVAPHGVDAAGSGRNLATPFASIKYATSICGEGATIFVKTGTYSEQLPITIPANVAIVGDNQRTVIVQPKTGNSDDGVTPNNEASMFLMSNGSILNKMTFKGMTGWVPGTTPGDVTTSAIKGVVVRLNPASPVTHKSPYVLECAFIGSGAIGALIDGSVHASGAKTMIFHGYTVITDNGVGYWVKDGGKAEIVSCFTYYAYFGYTASGGGFIRALNGNNSYGTWGATARGFDASENAISGNIVGEQLPFTYTGGLINVGDTVSNGAGATATVTNVQYSANKVYIKGRTGTFSATNALTFSSGGTGTCTSGAESQRGFVLVANGFSALPKPGASISLAGDTYSYVIQSVTNTWVDSTSDLVLLLSQEKPSGSAPGTGVVIRYKYSQIRLTGHDFLSIGTGGTATTNYPGVPTQPAAQGNETDEAFPGRVFYVSTDQDGNFRVGEYFRIDQATGRATLNASAFDLSGLSSLRLGSIGAQLGEQINEFSSDATMSGNSNTAVPTEYAVKTFVDAQRAIAISSAAAYTDTAKTQAISTAASAATAYTDTAKTQAISAANSYTDTAVAGVSVNELPLVNTISANKTLASNKMTFSMDTLTISGTATYTISSGSYHFVLNPNGFALFQ